MKTIPLHSSGRMKSARVILSPGEEIGEHVTENREEVIIVVAGSGSLVRTGQETPIREGEAHHVDENVVSYGSPDNSADK